MSRPNPRLDAALRYAAYGWPVFPLQPGEKIPLPRTHGLLEATTDDRQIARWLERHRERNIGIATGAPGPDVLDVDNKGQRSSGSASYNLLKREGLIGHPYAIVSTPSGGGFHAYYHGTDQHNGALREHGLDYRSRGGYVVAVPSQVAGRSYELVKRDAPTGTCDWAAIRNRLEPPPERPAWQPREGQDGGHLARFISALPDGEGRGANAKTFWAFCRAFELGDDTTAVDAIAAAAIERGLTPQAVRATQRSAERTIRGGLLRPKAQGEREAG
jgi:hypothetical protein